MQLGVIIANRHLDLRQTLFVEDFVLRDHLVQEEQVAKTFAGIEPSDLFPTLYDVSFREMHQRGSGIGGGRNGWRPDQHLTIYSVCPGLLSTKRDGPVAAFPESYIDSRYEQHCLGTPNSGRSYARGSHAGGPCPCSWMSPSVGSILGEQGQQPADQCRLYARLHRTGA